jgi:hypothetical protein
MDMQAPSHFQPITAALTHRFMEHRWGQRLPCSTVVRLSAGAGATGQGCIRNVSISGAFIETAVALPPFTLLEVIVVRDNGAETSLLASVVRRESAGIAVEWAETIPTAVCPLLGCASPCAEVRSAHE